jgi:hypothetical protein
MKDVTLGNGTVISDAEYIEARGDILTDYIPTRDDLISLAHKLVDELLTAEFFLKLQVSRKDINRRCYIQDRLSRLMEYLKHSPELDAKIREELNGEELKAHVIEELRVGREKNDRDVARIIAESEAESKTLGHD